MHILYKKIQKSTRYTYTREYNIVAIISLALAFLTLISFMVGTIITYSYLMKLGKIELFAHLISEEKLIYSIAFATFFILLVVSFYSVAPGLLFINEYSSSSPKEFKNIYLKDIIFSNIFVFTIWLSIFIYSIPLSEWNRLLYLLNVVPFIIFLFSSLYIKYSINIRGKYRKVSDKTCISFFNNIFFIISSLIAPMFIMVLGSEVIYYFNYDPLTLFIIFFSIFCLTPIILSFIFNSMILFWKKPKNKIAYFYYLTPSLFWIIPIYNISPLVMRSIGISETKTGLYLINNVRNEKIKKEEKGKLLLNYGEKLIFLEENEKDYTKSRIIDKNDIKLIQYVQDKTN